MSKLSVFYFFSRRLIVRPSDYRPLGLPDVQHLLHVDPVRLGGDRGDGAGGGLHHLGVEQPAGKLSFWKIYNAWSQTRSQWGGEE